MAEERDGGDQSMEDILASIRRIISEDGTEAGSLNPHGKGDAPLADAKEPALPVAGIGSVAGVSEPQPGTSGAEGRHGHDDVDAARLRLGRGQIAHDLAVLALRRSARHIDFDLVQRLVVVIVVAVRELIRVATMRDYDGRRHEAIVEPGNTRCTIDKRNREADDRRVAIPGQ